MSRIPMSRSVSRLDPRYVSGSGMSERLKEGDDLVKISPELSKSEVDELLQNICCE